MSLVQYLAAVAGEMAWGSGVQHPDQLPIFSVPVGKWRMRYRICVLISLTTPIMLSPMVLCIWWLNFFPWSTGFEIGNLHYLGGRVYFGVLQWSNVFMTYLVEFNITTIFMMIFQNKYTHIITLFMTLFIYCIADMLTVCRIRWFVEKVSKFWSYWILIHIFDFSCILWRIILLSNFQELTW